MLGENEAARGSSVNATADMRRFRGEAREISQDASRDRLQIQSVCGVVGITVCS